MATRIPANHRGKLLFFRSARVRRRKMWGRRRQLPSCHPPGYVKFIRHPWLHHTASIDGDVGNSIHLHCSSVFLRPFWSHVLHPCNSSFVFIVLTSPVAHLVCQRLVKPAPVARLKFKFKYLIKSFSLCHVLYRHVQSKFISFKSSLLTRCFKFSSIHSVKFVPRLLWLIHWWYVHCMSVIQNSLLLILSSVVHSIRLRSFKHCCRLISVSV